MPTFGMNTGWFAVASIGQMQPANVTTPLAATPGGRGLTWHHLRDRPFCLRLRQPRTALWCLGGVALLLGLAVYAWGRPALQGSPHAAWLGPLPSALHGLAFTLWLSLACARTRAGVAALAGGWALLNLCIETAQHPALFARLPVAVTRHWHGQFDPLDLLATALSATLAAALVARCLPRHALAAESTQT